MSPATPLEIQLWTLAPGPDPVADQTLLFPMLDDGERARWERFRDDRDKWSYAAAHGLCRLMLGAYPIPGDPPLAPGDWVFSVGPHGKPEVDPSATGAAHRPFSISHTRGLAACALLPRASAADARPFLGVDVEATDRPIEAQPLADRFFHPAEAQWLRGLPDGATHGSFMALWTLKEAVVKALGTGIQQGLESFQVATDPARLEAAEDPFGQLEDWRLEQWPVEPAFSLALALHSATPGLARIERRSFTGAAQLPTPPSPNRRAG